MTYRNLDEFLTRLEQSRELVRISTPVNPDLEIAAITQRVVRLTGRQNRALWFEHVEGSAFPVVTNLFSSPRRMAWALGLDNLEELNTRLARLMEFSLPQGFGGLLSRAGEWLTLLRNIGVVHSQTRDATVQEIQITDSPDCRLLPFVRCWPQENTLSIPLAQLVYNDPESGIRRVGLGRAQRIDAATLGLAGVSFPQISAPLPIALILGGDPAVTWSASVALPGGIDAYVLAGWLRSRSVKLLRGITQPVDVPADAEMVIEGWIDPQEQGTGSIFGDWSGFYTQLPSFAVMHVTAITHRREAVFPITIPARPPNEMTWMSKATQRLMLPLARLIIEEIVDIHLPAEGLFRNLALVSIRAHGHGSAHKVIYGLWGLGQMALNKATIVVNDDIDVQDVTAVADRVMEMVDWQRDLILADGPVHPDDHAALTRGFGGKIGVDATRKSGYSSHQPSAPLSEETITSAIGSGWRHWRNVIVIAYDRKVRPAHELIETTWRICPDYDIVLVDHDLDLDDWQTMMWRALANIDWRRDITLNTGTTNPYAVEGQRGRIAVDATSKNDSWPDVLEMQPDMIAMLNHRWKSYRLR